MSVINPDEWRPVNHYAVIATVSADHRDGTVRAAVAVLALLDLARYGTVQWFPATDPADVPWAPEPEPEWVRCVDPDGAHHLTASKVYRVLSSETGWVKVVNDEGWRCNYPRRGFAPATADEATVAIDVSVTWARFVAQGTGNLPNTCREALTKAGLL